MINDIIKKIHLISRLNFFGFDLKQMYLATYSPLIRHQLSNTPNFAISKITFELFWSLLFHLVLTEHHLQIWKGKSTKAFLKAENFAEVQKVLLQKVIFFRKQPSLTNIQPDKQSCSSSWNPGHKPSSSHKLLCGLSLGHRQE